MGKPHIESVRVRVMLGLGLRVLRTFAEVEAGDVGHEQHGDGHADGAAHGADHELCAIRDQAENHACHQRARLRVQYAGHR